MPRDDWRIAHDRSIASQAKQEFASEGRSSYPYVWEDDSVPELDNEPLPVKGGYQYAGLAKAVWCVHDNKGVAVASFDYQDRASADDNAADLTRQSGMLHYVALGKVR